MIRQHSFSRNKPCYYCGASPPSKREHVPPDSMFVGFDCDRITVPSCERHNSLKSTSDQSIVIANIMAAHQMWQNFPDDPTITSNIIKAIRFQESHFREIEGRVDLRPLLTEPPSGFDFPLPYIKPGVDLFQWVRQLSAAMLWNILGTRDPDVNWDDTWVWSPNFVSTGSVVTTEDEIRRVNWVREIEYWLGEKGWQRGWSASPRPYPKDVYDLSVTEVMRPNEMNGMTVIFRHNFYNKTSVWYSLFPASIKTVDIIKQFLNEKPKRISKS